MKHKPILIAAATAALCALPLAAAQAQGFSHGGHGGGGAMHGGSPGGSRSGSFHGGGPHGGWHGGGSHGNWHGGGWHGGRFYGGFGGPYWNFYLGAPWYPALAWGYPGYYPYDDGAAYYDDSAPAYWGPSDPAAGPGMNAAPAASPTQFRYYCPDGGYYPSVRTCPKGWVQMPDNPGQAPAAG